MKRTVKVKNLIAFAAVLILLFSITAIPAYAEFPPLTTAGRRLGSWILAALTAANITLTSTVSASQGADIINFLADPLDVTYSYTEMWDDKPTIQIWDDYTTIDGVTYTDVWLSNEAASKFKTDGMDFATAYSIASNTNGTFVEGAGFANNVPFFNDNGIIRTQNYSASGYGTFDFGTFNVVKTQDPQNPQRYYATYNRPNGTYINSNTWYSANDPLIGYSRLNGSNMQVYTGQSKVEQIGYRGTTTNNFVSSPFDFDYVAGTIDVDPLQPDQGLMLRMPSNTVTDLKDFLTDNPEFGQPGGVSIDVDLDPDIMTKLDDLINIIAPIIPIINNIGDVTFTVNHTEPTPPIPDIPIVDATVPQVVNPIINEISNYGDQITQQIPQIIETIPTIDSICENIDTAPYHDLDTGLDHLPSFFLPFITDLRSALGIWHYVTEWLAQISTTFAFVTGCLVGTSIMTPIYAAIAGFMCIKIYRRMTA